MPLENGHTAFSIHASAVAIDGRALLIAGRSGAGKSRLAHALVAASSPDRSIELVGDDRILLSPDGHRLVARPHPRIAGFIERRGLGLVAMPWRGRTPLAGLVQIGTVDTFAAAPFRNFPRLHLVMVDMGAASAVLSWWRDATPGHTGAETIAIPVSQNVEDWNW